MGVATREVEEGGRTMQPTLTDPAKPPPALLHPTESWGDRYGGWIIGVVAVLLLVLLVVFRVSR
jgi:hypothetical protein